MRRQLRRQLTALTTLLAAGERLPEYPNCVHACNQTEHIYPDSGNQKRVWPACPAVDGDCRGQCEDVDPNCPGYVAAHGGFGCEDNPAFMLTQCPKSCNVCHLARREDRCGFLADWAPALQPGDVNRTFERLTQLEELDVEVFSSDPWVVLVRGAMREDEIETLLRERSWQRASDTGSVGADGRATHVFSGNRKTDVHWCGAGCIKEPPTGRLISRIAEMLRVHPHYFELPQLLRYHPDMYYKTHHDAAGSPKEHLGTRIYTAFVYLSSVEEGGHTEFPRLGLKVKPERGAMLIWPSVFDHDPTRADRRTDHGALPVVSGTKFSANVWVHLGPFMVAHHVGCDGGPLDANADKISAARAARRKDEF